LNRVDPPDEEEQRDLYRRAVEGCSPHPVIFRTLDVGGDKMWESQEMPEEMNPVLGWRGIRFSLGRPDLFRTQLRALVRAAEGHRVRVMFPMITVVEELREAKRMLQEVIRELGGLPEGTRIEVGAMVEVPAAAMDVEQLAGEVDFLSIGTNDLIQYTMAVDRTNDRVAYLYQPTHPAVVRLISRVIETSHQRGIWVGVCGEMAGDVLMTPLLLGLGIDELSMGSVQVPRVKRAVQRLSWEETGRLAAEWLQGKSGGQIRGALLQLAQQCYPELLD
jgi:phosphoenolpyruvate-protein phosphotransferase (PTS system enzyme I)